MKPAAVTASLQQIGETVPHYDVERVRADFPILSQTVYGKPLVYLDSAASAQKPRLVLDAMRDAYETYYANVHRGAHRLSQLATDAYEDARATVAAYINARSDSEIVFTGNATEAINLVAASYGRTALRTGDEIIISEMEHHANIVPWHMLREETGVVLRIAPISDSGVLLIEDYARLLGPKTRLVALTHCSNVLGTITPVKEIVRLAHEHGATVLIDGSQGIVHSTVDVRDLDADFYVFTGHKLYGPTGIGVLYGKADLLERMPPYQGGGEMIEHVSFETVTFKTPPHRFEAGTPPIVEAIGLAAAIRYVTGLGGGAVRAHESDLLDYATGLLNETGTVRIFGTAPRKAAIISFLVEGIHPYDLAAVLDRAGVAVRVGQHCAEPLMKRLGVDGTVRASFACYSSKADVDAFVAAVRKAKAMLS
jgi:cysteine desulfurase / selenocysteine lyase